MNELLDPQRFVAIGQAIYQWLLVNVLVRDVVVQLLVIAATFVAALLLARRSAPLLGRIRAQRPFARS